MVLNCILDSGKQKGGEHEGLFWYVVCMVFKW
jgi:hypothetical protein